jgi:hypothetical protein
VRSDLIQAEDLLVVEEIHFRPGGDGWVSTQEMSQERGPAAPTATDYHELHCVALLVRSALERKIRVSA